MPLNHSRMQPTSKSAPGYADRTSRLCGVVLKNFLSTIPHAVEKKLNRPF